MSKALYFNAVHLFINFCAFVGCFVGFAAPISSVDGQNGKIDIHWNELKCDGGSCGLSFPCTDSGNAFFVFLLFSLPMVIYSMLLTIRRFGFLSGLPIPGMSDNSSAVNLEWFLCIGITICYFLSVVIWGGACIQGEDISDNSGYAAEGYGWVIFVLFLLFIDFALVCLVRRDVDLHDPKGDGSGGGASAGGNAGPSAAPSADNAV